LTRAFTGALYTLFRRSGKPGRQSRGSHEPPEIQGSFGRFGMKTAKTLGWLTGVVGVWEILAPFIIGYSNVGGATADAIILGILLAGFGLWVGLGKAAGTVRTLSWINALLGLWVLLAPFILGYSGKSGGATWNDVIVGVVVIILEVWGASAAKKEA
jgi:hypothetical protein